MTVATAAESGIPTPLFAAVAEVNLRQRERMIDRLAQLLGGSVAGARIALLGVTFKPDTDDLRDAPSIHIATRLIEEGATVVAFDPMTTALERFAALVPGVRVASSADVALDDADAAALVTEWGVFRQLDWTDAASRMRRAIMVDGRNALSMVELVDAGFAYASFGRGIRGQVEVPATAQVVANTETPASPAVLLEAQPIDGAATESPVERHRSGASGLDLALTD
jgi:UDPglucose 6-dehydrogenase